MFLGFISTILMSTIDKLYYTLHYIMKDRSVTPQLTSRTRNKLNLCRRRRKSLDMPIRTGPRGDPWRTPTCGFYKA